MTGRGARTAERSHTAVSWAEARELAAAAGAARPAGTVALPLAEAQGRVLAAAARALVSLPAHTSSAMDGWVVAGEPPWLVGAPIDAGTPARGPLLPGRAHPICTGAVIPAGARGVLRSEHGRAETVGGRTYLHRGEPARDDEPRAGEHIRLAGEEAAAGELLLARGTVLTPPRIALLAASGHDVAQVADRPTVDLLVLGDELAAEGPPAAGTGRVRDALTPSIPGVLDALGSRVISTQRVPDDRGATIAAMAGSQAELMVVTGGSSRGRTDHARAAAEAIGTRLEIDGVAMRPGHPVALGRRDDGRLVLLLPGNPFAALACLISFAAPALGAMTGRAAERLAAVRLAEPVGTAGRHTRLVAVALDGDLAHPLPLQGAAMLRGLAAADGLAVVQPGRGAVGATVPLLPLPW